MATAGITQHHPMPGSFADALAGNPVPRRLGDVSIRYEPSLLIGEADRTPRGLTFGTALVVGTAFAAAAILGLLADVSSSLIGGCTLAAGLAFFAAVQLDQRARRQRRFVLNFGTTSLRLDFSTPFTNHPRTFVVHFDGVRDCALIEQADGKKAITVDFVTSPTSPTVLREALVAHIAPADDDAAARFHRTLHGAFGLGEKLAPEPEPGPAPPTDAFTSG